MDFKDLIKQLSERVKNLKDQCATEEATKTALVLPFISMLGYDIFDPGEVNPEFIADIGLKKGEKIDYAILLKGVPVMLIECKHHNQNLDLHNSQLYRYFTACKAKFGILTNGVIYRVYTDLVASNIMDEKPFLELNLLDLKDIFIEEIKKFHKSYFDIDKISSTASELKYSNEIKQLILKELNAPSEHFVRYFSKQVYAGMVTEKILNQFNPIVKKSFQQLLNDIISERLKTALVNEEMQQEQVAETVIIEDAKESKAKIVTTEAEKEAFFVVKSILRSVVSPDRITYRDTASYFSILLDDNNRKLVCRLYFNNEARKMLAFIGPDKKEVKHPLNAIDDIFSHSEALINAISQHNPEPVTQ